MKTVNSIELINILNEICPKGLEVTIKNGILRITKSIYSRNNFIYLFSNDFIVEFNEENSMSFEKFKTEFKNVNWLIDQEIH
jgi:hypothetical protein